MASEKRLEEVVEYIKEYKDACYDPDPLHIVLDDGNIEDESIQWCRRLASGASEDYPDSSEEWINPHAVDVCDTLLELTEEDREEAYGRYWKL